MLRINLLPKSIYERRNVKRMMFLFGFIFIVLAAGMAAWIFKLSVTERNQTALVTTTEAEAKRVEALEAEVITAQAKIPPVKAKTQYITEVMDYNEKLPALYEEVTKYTYNRIEYRSMSASGQSMQISAHARTIGDCGRYLLNMYRAGHIFTSVAISAIPGWPAGSSGGGGMPGGMMGGMMDGMMMCPMIAVDASGLYIVRGNQVLKLSKDNLSVLASAFLPQMPRMDGMSGGAAGRGPSMTPRPGMNQMMQQMRQMQAARFEQAFLQNMIRHHQGAVDMSKLALTKATHAELRSFAQKTITNQGNEQQQFASWLRSLHNASAIMQPTQMDAQMTNNLSSLSGRDFEIQFMRDMITHHSEAVQMGRDAQQKATSSAVKAAATKIVNQQTAEIAQLQRWLSSWYGVSDGVR